MYSKFDYICRSLSKGTSKVYETYVVNAIWQRLGNENIEFATQQYVNTVDGRRFIDMYFPQIKMAIEVDEAYHNNEGQTNSDNIRMSEIEEADLNYLYLSNQQKPIEPERIKIYKDGDQLSYAEIDARINEVVKIIKEKYVAAGEPKWIYEEQERIEAIKARGYLKRGDSISKLVPIMSLFGKEYKSCFRCYYDVKGGHVWSPTLSVDGSDHRGWTNIISKDLKTIYESGEGKTPESAEDDKQRGDKRFVFLKYTDALGDNSRRFLGVYKAAGYEKNKGEIWEFVCDTVEL